MDSTSKGPMDLIASASIASFAASEGHSTSLTTEPKLSLAWKARDVAEDMMDERHVLVEQLPGATSTAGPHITSDFNTNTTLLRIRSTRAEIVHMAFDVAAKCLVDALKGHKSASSKSTTHKTDWGPEPDIVCDYKRLQDARNESLDRSHFKKEYAKNQRTAKTTDGSETAVNDKPVVVPAGEPSSTEPPTAAAAAAAAAVVVPVVKKPKSVDGPKFTRNTPASSAAALDNRFNSSRAILCAAGNIVFDALTPPLEGHEIDTLDVPQNSAGSAVNMGAVVVEAQTLGQRTIAVVENAIRRSKLRYQYRKDNARYDRDEKYKDFLDIPNPYQWKEESSSDESDEMDVNPVDDYAVPHRPREGALTDNWTNLCLPRTLAVLNKGAGHAIYHDVDWGTRHGRIADLLRAMSKDDNFGPHLIVTIEPEVVSFAQEFHDLKATLTLVNENAGEKLQALVYQGSKRRRRDLRGYWPQAKGLAESPFHVMVTSYAVFLEDYLHFCQLPFEAVILDNGVSWMAVANGDPNSAIGSIWGNGMWSNNDQHIGLAGTSIEKWNFGRDDVPESAVKDAWVGLTARHRIMTSASMSAENRQSMDLAPVSGLVSFVAPHFADVVQEEWDRSRILSDSKSMAHFRQLVARSTVVHYDGHDGQDMFQLAVNALNGRLEAKNRSEPQIPETVYDDAFVSDGKINFSRRASLIWLGPQESSWLRYELGKARLQNILDAMKISLRHGHLCEEITTASSTTSSGVTGQVAGSMAFRLAVRCGRHFGSEQGLRQHVSAVHAPPGTWLCRTCGSDCITSQARTHHERSCGQPTGGVSGDDQSATVGAIPTVGQRPSGKSGVGKKKGNKNSVSQQTAAAEEKDPDGSLRLPGFRGVWVTKAGKHFVKLDGERLKGDGGSDLVLFDNSDDAAKKYDEMLKARKKGQKLELNFKPDGSRVVYDDVSPATTSGLGGSAASVVPALSVINIKDLPPDVKPLLRDPRQTSRTGGNSKRHVYAYRGVCRQARKGHDRWQSQISFMGVNHYLGTFDSEWDAAAIYAWAHLILYGEEATRQAQKEGEEAAAAYEREKRDIEAGILPEPAPKAKKKPKKEEDELPAASEGGELVTSGEKPKQQPAKTADAPKKRKASLKENPNSDKKVKTNTKACKLEKEAIGSTVAKGVTKAMILAPRDAYDDMTDLELISVAGLRLMKARAISFGVSDIHSNFSSVPDWFRPCVPAHFPFQAPQRGASLLLGMNPGLFGWEMQTFAAASLEKDDMFTVLQMLAVEYDDDGVNERFSSVLQGSVTILGCANETTIMAYKSLGMANKSRGIGAIPVGGSVGKIDCHLGGVPGSCSEEAACIRYSTEQSTEFHLSCLSRNDMVTLNGRRITMREGSVPLEHEDIVSVGSRVFVFVLPVGPS